MLRRSILSSFVLAATAFAFAQGTGGTNDPRIGVGPGESATNRNGVTVETDADSPAGASINTGGSQHPQSEARSKTGWKGKISGLKIEDRALPGSNVTCKITGTGGAVVLAGGSDVTVENISEDPNAVIYIQMPSGDMLELTGGNSIRIKT